MLQYTAYVTKTPTVNPQTLFQVSVPSGQKVRIVGMDISLQGSTPASPPVPFEWLVQTSAGTSSPLTGVKVDRGADESIQATLLKDFTAEPTAGTVICGFSLHQQATAFWTPPSGRAIVIKGSERVGLRYASAVFIGVSITVHLQE